MATRIPGLGDLHRSGDEERYTLEHIAQAVAKGDWEEVTEASLGRIHQHAKSGKSYAVVSAWRSDEPSRDKNVGNSIDLQNHLAKKKYGYNKLTGMGQEEGGKVSANEPSYFVPNMTRNDAVEAGKKYGQHSVLYSGPETGGDVHLVRTTIFPGETEKVGDSMNLGKFHAGAMGQYFSRLRGKSHKAGVDDTKTPAAKKGKTPKSSTKDFTFAEDFIPILYKGDTTNEMRWFDTRVNQLIEQKK